MRACSTTAASSWASVKRPSSISSEPSGVPSDNLHRLPSRERWWYRHCAWSPVSGSHRPREDRSAERRASTRENSQQFGAKAAPRAGIAPNCWECGSELALAEAGEGAEVSALFGRVDLAVRVLGHAVGTRVGRLDTGAVRRFRLDRGFGDGLDLAVCGPTTGAAGGGPTFTAPASTSAKMAWQTSRTGRFVLRTRSRTLRRPSSETISCQRSRSTESSSTPSSSARRMRQSSDGMTAWISRHSSTRRPSSSIATSRSTVSSQAQDGSSRPKRNEPSSARSTAKQMSMTRAISAGSSCERDHRPRSTRPRNTVLRRCRARPTSWRRRARVHRSCATTRADRAAPAVRVFPAFLGARFPR